MNQWNSCIWLMGGFGFLCVFFANMRYIRYLFLYSIVKFECGMVRPTNLLRRKPRIATEASTTKQSQYILEQTGKNDAVQDERKLQCWSISDTQENRTLLMIYQIPGGFFWRVTKFAKIGNLCNIFIKRQLFFAI